MAEVVTFVNYVPPVRFDSLAWTDVNVEESVDGLTGWTQIDTFPLTPVDSDPEHPASRSFTTENGTALDYWYRLIFQDADGDLSQPTTPIQNTEDVTLPAVTPYATVSQLAALLKKDATTYEAEMTSVLTAAALEIDSELGRTTPFADPAPALVVQVNLERAVEHWHARPVGFGVIGLDSENPVRIARDTWERHAHKLAPLKESWGLA